MSVLAPDYVSAQVRLHFWDCLKFKPWLDKVDAVITDPPYGMEWNSEVSCGPAGHGNSTDRTRHYGQTIEGDDKPFDPSPWLDYPIVVLFGSNHFAQRLPVGTTLVWLKRFDAAFGTFLSDAELAWMKGGHGVYCRRDLSMNGEALTRCHPCQKPVSIMAWVMECAGVPEGATVLDPYMGSGTTGIACIRTNRKFIGIEKDPAHFATALERIRREEAQGKLL